MTVLSICTAVDGPAASADSVPTATTDDAEAAAAAAADSTMTVA